MRTRITGTSPSGPSSNAPCSALPPWVLTPSFLGIRYDGASLCSWTSDDVDDAPPEPVRPTESGEGRVTNELVPWE